jgi:hypothetical protein
MANCRPVFRILTGGVWGREFAPTGMGVYPHTNIKNQFLSTYFRLKYTFVDKLSTYISKWSKIA